MYTNICSDPITFNMTSRKFKLVSDLITSSEVHISTKLSEINVG
jgi:hypothetical protein